MPEEFDRWVKAIRLQALKERAAKLYDEIEAGVGNAAFRRGAMMDFNRTMMLAAEIDETTPTIRYPVA